MAGRLKGKVALVTAAGQGIGRAIAEAFVAEGARVIATDLDAKKLKGLRRAEHRALDVRSTAAVDALAKELGAIDVLVNCAGYVHHGTVLECTERDWDFSFDLNVKSMHRTIKAFIPAMLKKKKGAIVNIASGAARHPRQRHLSRHHRVPLARGAHHDARQDDRAADRRGAPAVRRPPAHGPARHAHGGRHARRLPCIRRSELHHRPHPRFAL